MPATPVTSSNLILGGINRSAWSASRVIYAYDILDVKELFRATKTNHPSQGQSRVVFLEVDKITEGLLSVLRAYAKDFAADYRVAVTINTRTGEREYIGRPSSAKIEVILCTSDEITENGAGRIFGQHLLCGNSYHLPPEEAAKSGLHSGRYGSIAFVDGKETRVYSVSNN